ncbi:peptidase M16, partial [Rhodospirillum rubrum]|uniref:M16 family metallopeptidase n=1 Tax=Rhodospirillum rubrum TaxID=1085 RepID=UPI001904ECAD
MKRLLFALVLLVAPWGAVSAQATPVQTVTTPSGVTAYLLADPTLPIVSLSFSLPGGSVSDPADRRGLATLASGLLDEGAGPYDSQAFRARLEDQAIELRFDAGRDSFSGRLKTTTATLDDAFSLLRLALHEPRFDAEPVDRIRAQVMTAVRMGEADPQTLASKALFAAVFADSPYAFDEQGSEEGLRAITADDLRGFVRRQLVRQGLAIGVAGDITPERLSALLERTFGDLPASSDQPPLPTP